MWEASVFLGQLLALQEGNDVGWMTKETSISFRQGQSFVLSSNNPGGQPSLLFSPCSE
jgi:hypothetical protein